MVLRAVLMAVVVAFTGCQGSHIRAVFSPEAGAQSQAETEAAEAEAADPEMAELMALLSRMSPPDNKAASAALTNIRQHSFQTVGRDTDPSVDAAGRTMVFASTAHAKRSDIFIKDVVGKSVTQLTTDPASDIQPEVSPDGRHVAFASNRSGSWEIYLMRTDGKSIRQLTRGGGDNLHPSWSPDGSRVVYCCRSDQSGQWDMWIVSLSAPLARQYVGNGLFPVWSPKEDIIAYQRPRGRAKRLYGIWTVRLTKGEPSLPTLVASSPHVAYVCPTFSQIGDRLAFSAVPPGGADSCDIYSADVDGRNLQQFTSGSGTKFGPEWVGDRVYFSYNRDGHENIWSVQVSPAPTVTASGSEDRQPVVAKK